MSATHTHTPCQPTTLPWLYRAETAPKIARTLILSAGSTAFALGMAALGLLSH